MNDAQETAMNEAFQKRATFANNRHPNTFVTDYDGVRESVNAALSANAVKDEPVFVWEKDDEDVLTCYVNNAPIGNIGEDENGSGLWLSEFTLWDDEGIQKSEPEARIAVENAFRLWHSGVGGKG